MRRLLNNKSRIGFAMLLLMACASLGVSLVRAQPSDETASIDETVASSTKEQVQQEEARGEEAATTTATQAPTDESDSAHIASTTTATTTTEVPTAAATTSATSTSETEMDVSETSELEAEPTPEPEEIAVAYVPPQNLPEVSAIPTQEDIAIDPNAQHSCQASQFTTDLSGTHEAVTQIMLHKNKPSSYELEIFNALSGIAVTFAKNHSHQVRPGAEEVSLDIAISKTTDAQKGSFTIPIVYTNRTDHTSVVCQINIINQ